jgi:predicted O-linked N-acetylglucosamine transferase (SPINDLY family)
VAGVVFERAERPVINVSQTLQAAVQHHQSGRLAEAEALYRQVLSVQPKHSDALHLLGVLAGQVGKYDAAVDLVKQALAARPGEPIYLCNLGKFLGDLGREEEAIAAYNEALRIKPGLAEAHNNLGNLLKGRGRIAAAIECYQRALAGRPGYPEAIFNWGNALAQMGKFADAEAKYREALALRPHYPAALNGLANALTFQGRYEEAAAACRQALQLQPDFSEACGNLGNALRDLRDFPGAIAAYRQAITLNPRDTIAYSNLLLAMNYDPASTRESLFMEARNWRDSHTAALEAVTTRHNHPPLAGRRIRIGYVSPDFRSHPVAVFLEGLLRHHDRGAFEIVCYSDVQQEDAVTRRLQAYADTWRQCASLGDAALAEVVHRDQIDVLMDLSMHSAYHRLLVFARRPAPVQGTWLAYPGTTGLSAIDFRITDDFLDPPEGDTSSYSEDSERITSFWCYAPNEEAGRVTELPAIAKGHVTFGCLNNFCKISDAALETWAELLGRIPSAHLLLHARSPEQRRRVVQKLTAAGIATDRIEFLGRVPLRSYFDAYGKIDIALDSFPCAGGTTSCDALYMGVPVVSLAGETAISRGGASILSNARHPEWIARTREEYVSIAAGLAQDAGTLARIRGALRLELESSPLMNGERFARDMETVYTRRIHAWFQSRQVGT